MNEINSSALIISFSGNKKVTKERILMMKNVKTPKTFVKVISIIISISIVFLGSTMVFAYNGTKVLQWDQSKLEIQDKLMSMDGSFTMDNRGIKYDLEGGINIENTEDVSEYRYHLIKNINDIQV